ncbi:MAG TPA: hypothetical protein VG734_23940 [Lacunisphaera sp.]|nr:hypothetical protein [Lacunisphaera sp.]
MSLPLLLACCLLTAALRAVPAVQPIDLAPDLAYLRVQSIVIDRDLIAATLAKPRSLVLDLRQTFDERDAGDVLRQLLGGPAGDARLYVLVSPTTPVPVVGAIAASSRRLITLGVKGSRPEPEVVVLQSADDDKKAYAALIAGAPPTDLISGRIEKERFDEASLVKEFKNGNHNAQPPDMGDGTTPPASPAPNGPTKPPAGDPPAKLTDRVLQRAVHLHRALQALKR